VLTSEIKPEWLSASLRGRGGAKVAWSSQNQSTRVKSIFKQSSWTTADGPSKQALLLEGRHTQVLLERFLVFAFSSWRGTTQFQRLASVIEALTAPCLVLPYTCS